MTHILYIDTSGKFSKILLFSNEKILASKTTSETNQHAQSLNIHIMEMLQESNVSWPVLSAVAVMNGPGSYTGLRIGLASAKGFCFARNTPLVLINQFDLMNYCNHSRAGKRAYFLKAREDEYFYTAYASAAEISTEVIVIDTASLHAESGSADTPLFTSDESLTDLSSDIEYIKILDTDIQRFVLGRFAEGRFADLMSCEPFYLKNVYINKINKL